MLGLGVHLMWVWSELGLDGHIVVMRFEYDPSVIELGIIAGKVLSRHDIWVKFEGGKVDTWPEIKFMTVIFVQNRVSRSRDTLWMGLEWVQISVKTGGYMLIWLWLVLNLV